MRRLLAFCLAVGAALSAGACGADGISAANTINFLAPSYSDSTKVLWESIITDFQREHPTIRVNLRMQTWTEIHETLRADLKSEKSTPDLLNLDAYANFARDGLLYEAQDVLPDTVYKDFAPAFANNGSLDGRQYGMPLFASTRMLFYNKDLFARAGLTAPPKTWDELTADARRITALDRTVFGYGMPLGPEEAQAETSIWTFGAGGQWSAGGDITVDTPANRDGVEAMKKLIDKGYTQPNPSTSNRAYVIDAFVQGKIGMVEGLPPTIAQIAKQNPGLKYATAPSPTKTGSPATLGVADHLMAFVKDGSKHQALQTFLGYFYSPAVYSRFVKTEGFIPTTVTGAQALHDDPVTRAFVSTLASPKFYPANNPRWTTTQSALRQHIGSIAHGTPVHQVLAVVAHQAATG